jgi:formate-dependent nitrite reductase membrane component NrfD
MNLFVADPGWGWWIVFYFYLGGIAAGAYFTAALIDLIAHDVDREPARIGYWLAFPLVCACGVLLIVDLHRPERFWHMLLKSEIVDSALAEGWPWSAQSWRTMSGSLSLKYWSPMSAGSWALAIFGLCSSLSLAGSLWPTGRLSRWFRFGILGRLIQLCGCIVGFFVAAYTGALLAATNQPLWSDSIWLASLFLTSAASTGMAAMLVIGLWRKSMPEQTCDKLERADLWVLNLELIIFVIFVWSIRSMLPAVAQSWSGSVRTWSVSLLLVGTALVAIVVPLAVQLLVRLRPRIARARAMQATRAAVISLIGGFVLRHALLATPPQMLAAAASGQTTSSETFGTPGGPGWLPRFSPEDGRKPGLRGADPGNYVGEVVPRSKVFVDEK